MQELPRPPRLPQAPTFDFLGETYDEAIAHCRAALPRAAVGPIVQVAVTRRLAQLGAPLAAVRPQPGVQRRRHRPRRRHDRRRPAAARPLSGHGRHRDRAAEQRLDRRRSTSIPGSSIHLTDVSSPATSRIDDKTLARLVATTPRGGFQRDPRDRSCAGRHGVTRGQLSDDRDAHRVVLPPAGFSEATVGDAGRQRARDDGTMTRRLPDHRGSADAAHRRSASKGTNRSRRTTCRSSARSRRRR